MSLALACVCCVPACGLAAKVALEITPRISDVLSTTLITARVTSITRLTRSPLESGRRVQLDVDAVLNDGEFTWVVVGDDGIAIEEASVDGRHLVVP